MTPSDFRAAMSQPESELARIASALDVLETRSAQLHGISAWANDTALAYESAVLTERRL